MDRGAIIVTILFFLVLVAGMFGYAQLKQNELAEEENMAPENTQTQVAYPSVERIDGKHYFIDGVHTIVGEVAMPTPCDLLEAEARLSAGEPETVIIDFNVINNAETCAAVITPQRFMVSATATDAAIFKAYFVDREVPLNLTPAAPGERPEEFELFIKG